MMHDSFSNLVFKWQAGSSDSLQVITPLVYEELRRIAANRMRAENPGHTLQATALVNEAFLQLAQCETPISSHNHFFALAAKIMRQVLVDHAKGKLRAKRGGGLHPLRLDDVGSMAEEQPAELLELDIALSDLSKHDDRKAKAIELHYFGGLSYAECATVLQISEVTIHRDLKLAKAWLKLQLSGEGP